MKCIVIVIFAALIVVLAGCSPTYIDVHNNSGDVVIDASKTFPVNAKAGL